MGRSCDSPMISHSTSLATENHVDFSNWRAVWDHGQVMWQPHDFAPHDKPMTKIRIIPLSYDDVFAHFLYEVMGKSCRFKTGEIIGLSHDLPMTSNIWSQTARQWDIYIKNIYFEFHQNPLRFAKVIYTKGNFHTCGIYNFCKKQQFLMKFKIYIFLYKYTGRVLLWLRKI